MAGNPFLQGASLGEGIVQQGFNTFMWMRDQAIAGQASADEKKRQTERDAQDQAAKFMTPLQVLHAKAGFPATMEVPVASSVVPGLIDEPKTVTQTMTSQEIWGKYGVPTSVANLAAKEEAIGARQTAREEAAAARGHTPATATMLQSYPKIKAMGFQEGDLVPDRFISEQSKPFAPNRGSMVGRGRTVTENKLIDTYEKEVAKEQAKLDRADSPEHREDDDGTGKKWKDRIPDLRTNRDRAQTRLNDYILKITLPSSSTPASDSDAILNKWGLPSPQK